MTDQEEIRFSNHYERALARTHAHIHTLRAECSEICLSNYDPIMLYTYDIIRGRLLKSREDTDNVKTTKHTSHSCSTVHYMFTKMTNHQV